MFINHYQDIVKKTNDGCNIGRLKAACQLDVSDLGFASTEERVPIADMLKFILSLQYDVGELSHNIDFLTFREGSLACKKDTMIKRLGWLLYDIANIASSMNISLEEIVDTNIEDLKLVLYDITQNKLKSSMESNK